MDATRSRVVGLTGGIGTGKSRVAELLCELGAAVECSDEIVRELQAPGGEVLAEIVKSFGEELRLPSGALDRAKLGERVFADPEARRRLGEIVHPRVYAELARRLEKHRRAGMSVVVLDIPLLLEGHQAGRGSGAPLPFDEIVLVYADEQTQVERIVARDGSSAAQARARVDAQMPIDEKRALADVVIDNTGDWSATAKQVRELYASWVSAAARSAPPR